MSTIPRATIDPPQRPDAASDDAELERIRTAAREAARHFPPMTAEQVSLAARVLREHGE